MTSRRVRCNCCGTHLRLLGEAETIPCPVCKTVIRVSCRPNNNGYVIVPAANQYHKVYANGVSSNGAPMNSYYPTGGTASYSYSQPPSLISPQPQVLPPPPPVYGRKRAVVCGINYRGHPKSLKGSANDARSMKRFLVERLGFPNASVLLLTEDETDPYRIPTKRNIRSALEWLVKGCQSGDSLVFHYSGHGSRVLDRNGDEKDGYDESLCPVDYETEGRILDDEVNAIIVRRLPHGAKLHAVIDTCYSGTLLDLPFMCRMNPEGYYKWEDLRMPYAEYKGTGGGIAISFSACDDHQYSGDTTAFTGSAAGALTHSFIQIVGNEARLTYGSLLSAMRNKISEAQKLVQQNDPNISQPQEPQLSTSEKFDVHSTPFII